MAMQRKPSSTRKSPLPSEGHGDIEHWISRVMPDLQPIVKSLDEQIRKVIPELRYAVKWKRAFYGLPVLGWIIEMVAYDVSVNVVLLGGAEFDSPPPLGDSGRSRYVKVRTLEDAQSSEMVAWIEQATRVPGWLEVVVWSTTASGCARAYRSHSQSAAMPQRTQARLTPHPARR